MKKIIRTLPFLILVAIFAVQLTTAEEGKKENSPDKIDKVTWYSLDTAIVIAKEQNKHVFIDFYTGWCGYCKKMDKEVFSDSAVIKLLNNDFVAAKVNAESVKELDIDGFKISEKDLSRQEFQVTGYPTYWWLTPDGKKLTKLNGYRPVNVMTDALTYIKDYMYDSTKAAQQQQPEKP